MATKIDPSQLSDYALLRGIRRQGIVNGAMEISTENGASTVALANNTVQSTSFPTFKA